MFSGQYFSDVRDRWLDNVFEVDEYYFIIIFLNYIALTWIVMILNALFRLSSDLYANMDLWSLILFFLLSMLEAKAFMFRMLYM